MNTFFVILNICSAVISAFMGRFDIATFSMTTAILVVVWNTSKRQA